MQSFSEEKEFIIVFFQGSEVLIGGTFFPQVFNWSRNYFTVLLIVRLYIVFGNDSSVA